MFRDFANSVTVALIAAPVLYMYVVSGWWLPTLAMLVWISLLLQLFVFALLALGHSTELYQYGLSIVAVVGAFSALLYGSSLIDAALHETWDGYEYNWNLLSFAFCGGPGLLLASVLWEHWKEEFGA